MNDAARLLRAQKSHSTDPDYLERMACAEETRAADLTYIALPGHRVALLEWPAASFLRVIGRVHASVWSYLVQTIKTAVRVPNGSAVEKEVSL